MDLSKNYQIRHSASFLAAIPLSRSAFSSTSSPSSSPEDNRNIQFILKTEKVTGTQIKFNLTALKRDRPLLPVKFYLSILDKFSCKFNHTGYFEVFTDQHMIGNPRFLLTGEEGIQQLLHDGQLIVLCEYQVLEDLSASPEIALLQQQLTALKQELANANTNLDSAHKQLNQLDRKRLDSNWILADMKAKLDDAARELTDTNQKLVETAMKLEQSDGTLEEYGTLLKSGQFSDVVIIASGQQFRAHRLILSFRSPVFTAMFEHNARENREPKVIMPDVKKEVIEEMLRFIYTGKAENLKNYSMELFQVADKYQLPELKAKCTQYLSSSINASTAVEILLFADQNHINSLKQQCKGCIKNHLDRIQFSEEWKELAQARPDLVAAFKKEN